MEKNNFLSQEPTTTQKHKEYEEHVAYNTKMMMTMFMISLEMKKFNPLALVLPSSIDFQNHGMFCQTIKHAFTCQHIITI